MALVEKQKSRRKLKRRGHTKGLKQPVLQLRRKETTKRLTVAGIGWLVKRGYSAAVEMGLRAWGSRRADLIALTLKRNIVICEVKSCWADFACDSKWPDYLDYCNQFYFIVTHAMWDRYKEKFAKLKKHGVGVMVLLPDGWAYVLQFAKRRMMKRGHKLQVLTRLAWRAGQFSKRNTFRTRVYLTTEDLAKSVK